MPDLSFNVIALDKASATFIRMAEQVDRLSDRLDRLDRKDVRVDVDVRTDESRKALDSFQNRFTLLASAVVAASPAIGAAIIGGVGAGFIGIAALAQASNKEVQDSYKGLWQDVVATTKNATDQLVPQLVGAGNALDATVQKLGPDIKHAFSFAGPDIVALTRGVQDAATNAMPGLTAAMQNSLPVMEGAAGLMRTLGTAGAQALTSLSQHSSQFGTDLQSLGSIVSSVLGTVVTIVNTIAEAWAQNAGSINASIANISTTVSGLATGVLPVFSAALGTAANVVKEITAVLGPLAPMLGTVGGIALATWAAFKLAALASVGVKTLAGGVVTLGATMEVGAVKAAGYIASLRGVGVQASATAGAVKVAGAATASAAASTAAAAESLAGPLGIALAAGTILFGLFATSEDHATDSTAALAAATDTMTSAFEASHGAMNASTDIALKSTDVFKATAVIAKQAGVSQEELVNAVRLGGPVWDDVRSRIGQYLAGLEKALNINPGELQRSLNALPSIYQAGQRNALDFVLAQQRVARELLKTTEFQDAAAVAANTLGVSLGSVTGGFAAVITSGQAASNSVTDVAAAFLKSSLSIAQATQTMADHFTQADQAVVQAQQSLTDANHSAAASTRAVSDAQHSLGNAQRSLQDAYAGVTSAQLAYTRAQDNERKAQLALNEAREQAIEDLKEMHLQLEDQVVSEQQARVRLFDAQVAAAKLGVDSNNAHALASADVTAANEEQVKAALDLLSAQNSLNDTLNTGENLRKDVADADRRGVDGAKGVISAQESLQNAHEQVISAEGALTKAHQQVEDAAYAVVRAHQAVKDAEYQRVKSSDAVTRAQQTLTDAQAAASRSFDINTEAGRANLDQLMRLWGAIEATGMPLQEKYKLLIDDFGISLGISRDRAQEVLTGLGLIPKDFRYNVTAVAGADLSAITETTINGVRIFTSALGSGGIASAGRLAGGGLVTGPGGPTDDMVPLWGSPNEFMQPADAVGYYGLPFMEAVRTKRLRVAGGDGASIRGYAKGGLIDAFAAYANLSTAYVADVNTLQVMGFPHPAQLPRYVPPAVVPVNFAAGSGVARWAPQILQALALLGQSADWLGTVERRMNQESGGNPTIVNRWDSNWLRGTPSVGLMQVIGPTFARWAGQFAGVGPYLYGVSVDPLANTFAGLNYAIHRYGSLSALNRPGGYRNGGVLPPGGLAYNETTEPEVVFNKRQIGEMGGVHHHYHLTVNAPVGSQRELENWFVKMHSDAESHGRIG